jgi:hypothetical protein
MRSTDEMRRLPTLSGWGLPKDRWRQPEAILVNKFPQLSFEEVLKMLDLQEVNLSETRFYQDVLQKGREQEREQGVQREVDLVLRRLERRCGILSIDCLRQATPTTRSSQIPNHHSIGISR